MYLVFIAMLALNVSSEVLDGFELVEENLLRSVKASTQHNDQIFSDLKYYYDNNKEKAEEWYGKGAQVKERTDSLYSYIQDLKIRIVKKSDGKEGDPEKLKHPDDLNASQDIMFQRGSNEGERLRSEVDSYREFVSELVTTPSIKSIIENNLSTEPSEKAKKNKQTWEESMFWNMPMAAAITLLTKLQNDIRYAEGEVLSDLLKNVDVMDLRVNDITAFVIPESQTIMAGGTYKANIVMAAVDTTQRPRIFIGEGDKATLLSEDLNGRFERGVGTPGTYTLNGYVEMPRGDGSFLRRDFSEQYVVTQPAATIAPVLMNVLYAGIENEINLAVPGVATQNVTATSTNGNLVRKNNDLWAVTPRLGSDAVISVTANMSGRSQVMGTRTFRVRPLPDPVAYLNIVNQDGNKVRFRGGPIAKSALLAVENLNAAIDDGILDMAFTVLRFEVNTTDGRGMTKREVSDGPRFSQAQRDLIRQSDRGKTVLVTRIVTRAPSGEERTLQNPIEIILAN